MSGCLPISAMVHVPKAKEVFDPEGGWAEGTDGAAWSGNLGRGVAKLLGRAQASAAQRALDGPATNTFARDPCQRNAP